VLTALFPSEIVEKPSIRSLLVGELLSVRPASGSEDAVERVGVGALDLLHRVGERGTNVVGRFADVVPVAALGNLEAVDLLEVTGVSFPVEFTRLGRLFVPDVTDPLEEQQRQDVALPVGAIDSGTAQRVGGLPEARLELLRG